MKLDHTFIAIRERSILEICDLALHVIRDHFQPLMILLLIGALPWILFDWWITRWLIVDIYSSDYRPFYFWLMAMLVISQAQVGTTLITYYLGQAMFVGWLGIRETISGTFRTSPYFLWSHGGIRLVLPILFFAWLTQSSDEDTLIAIGGLWLPFLVATAVLIRALRPFVSEMLLLEKTPISSKDSTRVTFKRRSQSLHASAGSELFGRSILTSLFFPLLAFSFFALFVSADSALNLQASAEMSFSPWYWVISLWLVSGIAAVIRFLSYIDIRIRQEGWSVELKMRAEGQRLTQPTA